jgi:hypothetical protein
MPVIGRAREQSRRLVCVSNQRTIVLAWLAYANDNDRQLVSANTAQDGWAVEGGLDGDIQRGLLFKYMPQTEVYRCPSDYNLQNRRSYSINGLLNGQSSPSYSRLEQVKFPSKTFVTIEELDPRGYNEDSFQVPNTGDTWVDIIANWHKDGYALSFADGRAEFWHCDDPRTLSRTSFYTTTPNNPDLKHLQAVVGY